MATTFVKDGLYLVDENIRIKKSDTPSPIKGFKAVNINDIPKAKVATVDPTDFKSVYIVNFKSKETDLDVSNIKMVGFSNLQIQKVIESVLSPKFKDKTIIIEGGSRASHQPAKEGELKVHLGYSPLEGEYWFPYTCWGIEVDGSMQDSSTEYGIFEDDEAADQAIRNQEGQFIAALVGNDLYIYLEIVDCATENMLNILRKILKEVKPIKNEEYAYSKESYVNLCKDNVDSFKRVVEEDLTKIRGAFDEARELFVKSNRSLDALLKKSSKAPAEDDLVKHFSNQYDIMIANPYIEKLRLTKTKIIANTINIDSIAKYGKQVTKYDIGKFKIVIDIATGSVKFGNLTRRVEGYNHPHVCETGEPCLGSIRFSMAEFAAHHEYGALLDMAIAFLLQVNPDSTYNPIENWPEKIERKKATKRKKAAKRNSNRSGRRR